jgi:predicted DNA-binding transcriptional regulator YafY
MGNWHLIAYCDLKKGIRDFLLSRISKVEMLNDMISTGIKNSIDKKDIYMNYGIFFEGKGEDIVLKFSEKGREIVKEQIWFPEQKISEDKDGNMILSFPVADYREVLGDILRFGSEVEVISPTSLRKKLKTKIDEMKKIYG